MTQHDRTDNSLSENAKRDTVSGEYGQTFARLVVEHQSRVRSYISSLGVAGGSIDDIAQDAFVVAYEHFDTFEQGTSFPAWVNRIARNLILNDRRKTSRRFRLLNERGSNMLIEEAEARYAPEEDHSDERRQALRQCMDTLPKKSRKLLEIRYKEGLEPSRISEKVGVSASTLRTQLKRIRDALYRCISTRLYTGKRA